MCNFLLIEKLRDFLNLELPMNYLDNRISISLKILEDFGNPQKQTKG